MFYNFGLRKYILSKTSTMQTKKIDKFYFSKIETPICHK